MKLKIKLVVCGIGNTWLIDIGQGMAVYNHMVSWTRCVCLAMGNWVTCESGLFWCRVNIPYRFQAEQRMNGWLVIIKLLKVSDLWPKVGFYRQGVSVCSRMCVVCDRDRENARPMCASMQLNNRCPNLENAWRQTVYGVWSERNHSTLSQVTW